MICTMAGIFVFKFIFQKERCKTLFVFIFSAIIMGIATTFYGCIAFYGWPYVHGDCKTAIQEYKGFVSNKITFTLDPSMLQENINSNIASNVTSIQNDLNAIFQQKWMAGPKIECLVDDDCHVRMQLCISGTCGWPMMTYKDSVAQEMQQNTQVECAKGRDCGPGYTCKTGNCVKNRYYDECGSKLDCSAGNYCNDAKKCVSVESIEGVPQAGFKIEFTSMAPHWPTDSFGYSLIRTTLKTILS